MRKLTLAVLAMGMTAGVGHAADMGAPAPGGYDWSGFYVGIGVGAGAGVHELEIPPLGGISLNGIGREGVFGEVTVGYDHMLTQRFLVGIYADARLSTIATTLDLPGFSASVNSDYGFDVLARAGYLVTPRTLIYALGGYSWQHFQVEADFVGDVYDWSSSGFVIGAGVESVIRDNWTLKTEYRYSDYGSEDHFDAGFLISDPSYHTFHVGLNYRLNGDNPVAGFATPAYDWTGFYVGAAAGAGGIVHDLELGGAVGFNGIGAEGIFGEISVGYDHDFGNGFVAGIMADARLSTIATTLSTPGGSIDADADYGFDILGRIGMKLDEATLVYALGGYSWQHFDINASPGGSIYDWGASGFSVGGGIEAAVTEQMSVNLEYRYSQYEDEDFGSGGFITAEPSAHTARLGVKYRF